MWVRVCSWSRKWPPGLTASITSTASDSASQLWMPSEVEQMRSQSSASSTSCAALNTRAAYRRPAPLAMSTPAIQLAKPDRPFSTPPRHAAPGHPAREPRQAVLDPALPVACLGAGREGPDHRLEAVGASELRVGHLEDEVLHAGAVG